MNKNSVWISLVVVMVAAIVAVAALIATWMICNTDLRLEVMRETSHKEIHARLEKLEKASPEIIKAVNNLAQFSAGLDKRLKVVEGGPADEEGGKDE